MEERKRKKNKVFSGYFSKTSTHRVIKKTHRLNIHFYGTKRVTFFFLSPHPSKGQKKNFLGQEEGGHSNWKGREYELVDSQGKGLVFSCFLGGALGRQHSLRSIWRYERTRDNSCFLDRALGNGKHPERGNAPNWVCGGEWSLSSVMGLTLPGWVRSILLDRRSIKNHSCIDSWMKAR